jgi:hypothetical protein
VLIASAAIAVVIAKLTAGSDSSPPVPAQSYAAAAPAEIRSIPAAESGSFAILRRAQTPGDLFKQIRPGQGPYGANPTLSRAVALPAAPLAPRLVSVVPADGGVCLRILEATAAASWWCQSIAHATRGQLIVALGAAGSASSGPLRASSQFVVGLVPDGVAKVKVSAAGGVTRTVVVHDNVYATQLYEPTAVVLTLPGRRPVSYPVRY